MESFIGGHIKMSKVAISCDSTSAISQSEAKKLGIFVLPLNVIVNDIEYHDGIDIDNPKLAVLERNNGVIKTSTPTFLEMENFFDNIFAQGYDKVIHLTISSKLTSIFNMFTLGCKERYGDKVIIIDSFSACRFMGNLVLHAKKMLDNGETVEAIVKEIENRKGIEDVYFIPETLTYLKRGGRISPAAASVGNLLGIKPVLRFVDGGIDKYGTTRAVKQVLPQIIAIFKSKNLSPEEYELHIVEFDCDMITKVVYDILKEQLPEYNIVLSPISINVCAHTGPGTIGIGFTKKA